MSEYLSLQEIKNIPRLPLEGSLDLTYRCNDNCRHCWLRIPPNAEDKKDVTVQPPEVSAGVIASEAKQSFFKIASSLPLLAMTQPLPRVELLQKEEISFEEIKQIVDAARRMGCRRWSISGGEPMLRPDFPEIFDYITNHSNSYSINTNGTLITSQIAGLMKRKGTKMVALYGATAEVHDHITRNPGSYAATMRGFRYLKEAGAGFTVQLIPMKDNYHQFKDMIRLAESLSKHYRVGAAWLYLSACADSERNAEIIRQRLPPKEVVELDKPDLSYEERMNEEANSGCHNTNDSGYLFSSCIAARRDFHIDPYGKMTFCCFIKDPALRYDLKNGSFQDCWENFIPSLAVKVKRTEEYNKNCGSCEERKDCRICPVYGYLEHKDFNKKVEYLCAVAQENRRFKDNWRKNHRRYFKIADITVQVESDLPIKDNTFHPKFKLFEVAGPGEDTISIRHHFSLPDLDGKDLGKEVYRKPPWAIYKNNGSWIYLGISPTQGDKSLHRVVTFNAKHTRAEIYNDKEETFLKGNGHSLTMFPSDQILLARVLADRGGCYLHSCGVNFKGKGLLFAGHSEAGKSTMATMLKGKAEILCDDRIIVRAPSAKRQAPNTGFRIYGTWSHGDVPDVSANSAPLRAILFLNKSAENRLKKIEDKKIAVKKLLSCLIRPFVTVDWWEKSLGLLENISQAAPCYELYFDKSGEVVDLLGDL